MTKALPCKPRSAMPHARFESLVAIALIASLGSVTGAEWQTFKVTRTLPHDTQAFTQGLVFHDNHFIEGTGKFGGSSLRLVEPRSGKVQKQTQLSPQFFGEGVAVAEDRVIQLTWKSGKAVVYDLDTLEQIGVFTYQGQGWGLTFDGQGLIMSDGSATLYFRDPHSFALVETVKVTDNEGPVHMLNELEWIKGEIWANQWQTDRIARIAPDTGEVLAWIDFSGLFDWPALGDADAVLNGIAHDREGDRIFVTGKTWPFLFEVQVAKQGIADKVRIDFSRQPGDALKLSFPSFRGARYNLEHWDIGNSTTVPSSRESITGTGHALTRTLALPQTGDGFFRVLGE
jgi:glutaminyl-peptide cyclotransferase